MELRAAIGRADTPGMMNMNIIQATILRDGGQPNQALRILNEASAASRPRRLGRSIPALEYESALTLVRLGRTAEALPGLSRVNAGARERGDVTLDSGEGGGWYPRPQRHGQLASARALLNETEPLYARLRAEQQYTAGLFLSRGPSSLSAW